MAKNRSNRSKYPSNYGGGWVSASQYLTECLCVLIAKNEKKELSDKFWNNQPWKNIFRRQTPLATNLIKDYSPEVVLSVLRDKRCRKIRSFGANWLLGPMLEEKNKEYLAIKSQQTKEIKEKTTTTEKPRKSRNNKKSLLSYLKEAE